MQIMNMAINWAERGFVPDYVLRTGIRHLIEKRLLEISADNCEAASEIEARFIEGMNRSPIALLPELANEE